MGPEELDFERIHASYRPNIGRYLTRLVGEYEAEDLTQEVFARVGGALGGFRGESKLSTWLYRIATNAALDRLRSSSFRGAAQEASLDDAGERDAAEIAAGEGGARDQGPSAEQQVIRKQMNECIRDFIQGLPGDYRTVLVLADMEDLKNREIAEILGVSLETVKIRLHRARRKLKEELMTHCGLYWVEENEYLPDMKAALRNY